MRDVNLPLSYPSGSGCAFSLDVPTLRCSQAAFKLPALRHRTLLPPCFPQLLLPHAQRKVRHDLAAEYRVLQQASPGSYAVLSTATATGDKTSSASVGKPSGSGGGGGGVATHSGSLSLASLGLALPSGQSAAAHVNVFGGASAGGSSAAPSSVVAGKPGGATEQQLQAEAVRGVASGGSGGSSIRAADIVWHRRLHSYVTQERTTTGDVRGGAARAARPRAGTCAVASRS